MRGGGQLVGVVAEAEFDPLKQLGVRGIDEVLGHAAQGLLGGRPELVHDGGNAGFTVLRGRRRG